MSQIERGMLGGRKKMSRMGTGKKLGFHDDEDIDECEPLDEDY